MNLQPERRESRLKEIQDKDIYRYITRVRILVRKQNVAQPFTPS